MRIARTQLGWGWILLGLAGTLAISGAGADLLERNPIRWWFRPGLPGGSTGRQIIFIGGIAALCAAWLAVGRRVSGAPGDRTRELLWIGTLWALPLIAGPVLFSRDMYSYLADGSLLRAGISPYTHAPDALTSIHQTSLLDAVSPFWRHTTAPYGPSFVGISSAIAAIVGPHLIAGVVLLRAVELAGVILLAVFVPRLARSLGADPARATWLAVISPLVLLELIAAGHNDALMAGLLVAGVAFAVERRPLVGIVLCALAATIKLPAAAGILLIALVWWRAEPDRAAKIAALTLISVLVVLLAVGLITGLGLGWVSSSTLSTPGKVRLAITPSTEIGYSAAGLLHALGFGVATKALESAVAAVLLVLTGLFGVVLCMRVRYQNLVWCLGLLLLVSVVGGPAAWPWYLSWGIALLAACSGPQRWRWLPLVIAASSVLVHPNGQLVLQRGTAPIVLAVYLVAALLLWRSRGGRATERPARLRTGMLRRDEPATVTTG